MKQSFHSRINFRSKLLIIFTFFTGVISAAFVFVLVSSELRNHQDRSTEKAQLLASLLAGNITLNLYSENITELSRHAQALFTTPHLARIAIFGNNNRKLIDMTSPDLSADSYLVTATAPVVVTTTSPSAEVALSGVSRPPPLSIGRVSVSVDAGNKMKTIRSAIMKAGGIAAIFWAAVVVACYPLLRRLTRSVNTLTEGLDSMMAGKLPAKIIISENDEAGRAAQAINRLATSLEERELENRILHEELVNAMRLEVQEERRNIMAKLIQTNRMTSLGLLISSIAHNINTPNGAIKLAAQHLAASWKNALPILEQVTREEGDFNMGGLPFSEAKGEIAGANESILKNAEKVERAILDLRTYNLGGDKELSPGVAVNRVVEEALTIIRAHGRQGEISIAPALDRNLPDITANQCQLEQVVVNLLLNAMQAMPSNQGVITVSTGYAAEENEVRIVVTDQGEGLPPEARDHLFEAFFTTRIDKGGSGLGLYISNFIVLEHKGRLTIDPAEGEGTVATVHLPVSPENPARLSGKA